MKEGGGAIDHCGMAQAAGLLCGCEVCNQGCEVEAGDLGGKVVDVGVRS